MTHSTITITRLVHADRPTVWDVLTAPELVSQWIMGAKVQSDWQPGSAITWSGQYNGQAFEDRGEILEIDHEKRLVHSHYSPMSGADDVPASYHRVEWNLTDQGDSTELTLKMPVDSDEQAAEFEQNWGAMLDSLKHVAER